MYASMCRAVAKLPQQSIFIVSEHLSRFLHHRYSNILHRSFISLLSLCTLFRHLDADGVGRQYHGTTYGPQVYFFVSFVGLFDLGDLIYMLQRHFSNMFVGGFGCSLSHVGCLEQEPRCRWRLHLECERTVRLDGQKTWNRGARLKIGGSSVEFLTKIYGFDTLRTKSRTHRWSRSRLSGSDDQLDQDILGRHGEDEKLCVQEKRIRAI